MPFPDADPDHRWAAARIEDSDAAQRQKKRWNPHLVQSLSQPVLCGCCYCSEKAQRQMKLFLRNPAQPGQMRVELEQRSLASRRKCEANK